MKPLISAISFLLIFERASSASLKAGKALPNSAYASSAIILISEAYVFTIYASSFTNLSF
jgi:hypothetical protein